jgi:hypothetical protein
MLLYFACIILYNISPLLLSTTWYSAADDDDDKKALQQRAGFVDGCVHQYNGVVVDGVDGDAYVLADQLFDGSMPHHRTIDDTLHEQYRLLPLSIHSIPFRSSVSVWVFD